MRIKLQNIGIIAEADININGITLVAGKNDSGKSTVGKVLYSLIRSLNINEESFNFSKVEFIQNKLNDIRNLILRTRVSNARDEKIRSDFFDNFLTTDSIFSIHNRLNEEINSDKITQSLSSLDMLFSNFSNQPFKNQLIKFINDIEERLSISLNSSQVIQYELETYLENEFGSNIRNSFRDEKSFIEIDLGLQKNRISVDTNISIGENLNAYKDLFYQDVFFIETPLDLNNRRLVFGRTSFLRNKKNYLNYKLFQTNEKLDFFSDTSIESKKLNQTITEIIAGGFGFNNANQLVFKKQSVEFDLNNVATGIKSFGIIQMLMENGSLNSNSLLIIDEPEVHLHPDWQVKFAEILIRVSKEFAIPILLTSHSPYFIEALEACSKKYKYEELTNFYYTQKNEDGLSSKIINATNDINAILLSLTDAYYKIKEIEDESENQRP